VCRAELGELGSELSEEGIDDRILVVNAVSETTKNGEPATAEFVWKQAQELKTEFPQVVDAKKTLYKFSKGGTIGLPFQVGIDLRTMKVLYAGSGSRDKAFIEETAKATFE
jgi:hypothetical protein